MNGEYKIEETKRAWRKILSLALVLVGVIIIAGLIYYFTKVNQAYSSTSHPSAFTVASGAPTRVIAEDLAEQKIISNSWVFIFYTTLKDAGGKIQAGEYMLDSNMSIAEIVDTLTHGKVVSSEHTYTTIEGWTNAQIASYLTAQGLLAKDSDFAAALANANFDFRFDQDAQAFGYQGFLFPDTYKLAKNEDAADLAQKMLTNFEFKFTDQMIQDMLSSGKNLKDVIILASIIEKEVGRNQANLTQADLDAMQKERTEVASVFYNRLAAGMPLESDATVNYITGKKDRQVLLSDTKIDSPYNTYMNRGLPPGPIANPGIGSIMAAIYPADTNYLYFLNKPNGEAVFAATYPEHIANIQKYLP